MKVKHLDVGDNFNGPDRCFEDRKIVQGPGPENPCADSDVRTCPPPLQQCRCKQAPFFCIQLSFLVFFDTQSFFFLSMVINKLRKTDAGVCANAPRQIAKKVRPSIGDRSSGSRLCPIEADHFESPFCL